jgi:molybdate transport system ATP-binding protein
MTLEVDIRKKLGAFSLDVRFEAGSGLTALFGRSGAGKTSVINIIAGLTLPDEGRVIVNGISLVDTARGVVVPRHRRRLGYVFQEGRLFPHLSVRQNLLYGRWFSGDGGRRGDVSDALKMLGIEHLLDRRPAHLSGGEKQRVAIGRALLANPRLLLMDEPLASLDEARRQEIMPYLERLRDKSNIPIVYVSHSVAEVARLATTIIVLSEGRVVSTGPAAETMQRIDLFPLTGRAEAGALIEAIIERPTTTRPD